MVAYHQQQAGNTDSNELVGGAIVPANKERTDIGHAEKVLMPDLKPDPDSPVPPPASSPFVQEGAARSSNVSMDLLPGDIYDPISTPAMQANPDAGLTEKTSGLTTEPVYSTSLDPWNVDDTDPRPATPAKDNPGPTAASPPPPPPPPKDVPSKELEPKEPSPAKTSEPASEDCPNGRIYLDPPLTPVPSRPGTPSASQTSNFGVDKPGSRSQPPSDDENDDTRSEIHDLFAKSHRASMSEEQLQLPSSAHPSSSSPLMSSPGFSPAAIHPPRSSSLGSETNKAGATSASQPLSAQTQFKPEASERPVLEHTSASQGQTKSAAAGPHRPPSPDEDLPFDFHRFLSQLRHRSADPVAKFLRSFLHEFAKKQWMVHEQVKIIRDFLNFIYAKMDMCEVWREVGDGEMDNAMEGMEKLVMNRLYTQTFSPAIPPPAPLDGRSRVDERFPGRRGQHQEDVERDEILTQKVRIYSWVREEHLDIGDTISGEGGRRFLDLAVKEMLKIGSYRAPRDKVICVLNCCKVIFGLLRHSKSEESADKFVPLLIYVVLRANPEHLVSNVQYILRFRNPDKLTGEAGYYLSSLMGAIQFVENLDRSSLTITDKEFEANVEAAVAAIAERPPPPSPPPVSEKPRRSTDQPIRTSTSSRESSDRAEYAEEKAAVSGLLRTIQKPLTTIGRIFSDEGSSSSGPAVTPQPGSTPRHSPHLEGEDTLLTAVGGRGHRGTSKRQTEGHGKLTAEEAAARQASAEAEEAARIGRIEYENVVEILKGMFPALDREIIGDVVRMKEGRVGLAVDACLALSAT